MMAPFAVALSACCFLFGSHAVQIRRGPIPTDLELVQDAVDNSKTFISFAENGIDGVKSASKILRQWWNQCEGKKSMRDGTAECDWNVGLDLLSHFLNDEGQIIEGFEKTFNFANPSNQQAVQGTEDGIEKAQKFIGHAKKGIDDLRESAKMLQQWEAQCDNGGCDWESTPDMLIPFLNAEVELIDGFEKAFNHVRLTPWSPPESLESLEGAKKAVGDLQEYTEGMKKIIGITMNSIDDAQMEKVRQWKKQCHGPRGPMQCDWEVSPEIYTILLNAGAEIIERCETVFDIVDPNIQKALEATKKEIADAKKSMKDAEKYISLSKKFVSPMLSSAKKAKSGATLALQKHKKH